MKTYKQYVNEEVMPFAQTDKAFVGIESEAVRDNINDLFDGVTNKGFVTPYNALERISKVLAYAHIHLPKYTFSEGDHGATAFQIHQFGIKSGMTNDGEFIKDVPVKYYVYFEYHKNDTGLYDVFASIVDKDELDDLVSDYKSESDNDFDGRFVDDLNQQEHDYERNMKDRSGYLEERMVTDPANPARQVIPETTEKRKELYRRYIKAASHDVAARSAAVRGFARDAEDERKDKRPMDARRSDARADKMFKKSWQRRQYMAKAVDKLEEENINEVGDTRKGQKKLGKVFDRANKQSTDAWKKKDFETGEKRGKVADQAYARLKEEQLDEISTELARNYLSKNIKQRQTTNMPIRKTIKRTNAYDLATAKLTGQSKAKILTKEETQLDEKLSSELKRKIRRRLGPNTPENRQRQNSDSAREEIRLAKRGGKDKELNETSKAKALKYVNAAKDDKDKLVRQLNKDLATPSKYHDSEQSRAKDLALGSSLVKNRTQGIARAEKILKKKD